MSNKTTVSAILTFKISKTTSTSKIPHRRFKKPPDKSTKWYHRFQSRCTLRSRFKPQKNWKFTKMIQRLKSKIYKNQWLTLRMQPPLAHKMETMFWFHRILWRCGSTQRPTKMKLPRWKRSHYPNSSHTSILVKHHRFTKNTEISWYTSIGWILRYIFPLPLAEDIWREM